MTDLLRWGGPETSAGLVGCRAEGGNGSLGNSECDQVVEGMEEDVTRDGDDQSTRLESTALARELVNLVVDQVQGMVSVCGFEVVMGKRELPRPRGAKTSKKRKIKEDRGKGGVLLISQFFRPSDGGKEVD